MVCKLDIKSWLLVKLTEKSTALRNTESAARDKLGTHLAGFTTIDRQLSLCYAVQWDLAGSYMQVSSL
jgi:hypothetical protein